MLRFISSLCLFAALVAFGLYFFWLTPGLPLIDTNSLMVSSPNKWTQVYAADGKTPILSHGKFHFKHVDIDKVSQDFKDALIATEDRRFYQHKGIDLYGVLRATVINITKGSIREGASTLTQQLSRNVFLNNERSLKRKLQEMLIATELEKKLSKDEILELYVNHIYFGEGAYGISAASEIFFNKSPDKLSLEEAALLAGLPQAPTSLNPFYNKERAVRRRNEVLTNLYEVKKLDKDTLNTAIKKPVSLNPNGRLLSAANRAPFFNQMVVMKVRKLLELDEQTFWQSGLKIYTTLNHIAQKKAQQAIQAHYRFKQKSKYPLEASIVSIEPETGKILAYVGGANFARSQFDRVSTALRAPGSLFKVFTYTAAIEKGFKPDRIYLDEPIKAGKWEPKNYDKKFHGYMSMAKAFVKSNNVVAVKTLHEVTPDAVIQVAKRMGVQSQLESNLSLTLGSSSMTLLDVTSAIGTLANKGVRSEPYGIEKIANRYGDVLYEHYRIETEALDQKTVDQMTRMMLGVVRFGTGGAANIGRQVAGKTGTSDEHRDGWFVGFTPDLITGVWMGYDNNTPVYKLSGGGDPALLWKHYMKPYYEGKPKKVFQLKYGDPITSESIHDVDLEKLSPIETHHPLALAGRILPTTDEPDLEEDGTLNGEAEQQPFSFIGPPAPQKSQTPQTEPSSIGPKPPKSLPKPPNPLQQNKVRAKPVKPPTIKPHIGSRPKHRLQPQPPAQQANGGPVPPVPQ